MSMLDKSSKKLKSNYFIVSLTSLERNNEERNVKSHNRYRYYIYILSYTETCINPLKAS